MALQPKDRPEFSGVLTRTAAMYGVQMAPSVIDLWWEILADYDMPSIRHALTLHLRNPDSGQFMPKPADVIRMLSGTTQDSAQIAWAKVAGAIRKVGSWFDVAFDDPLIHCVLSDMGGWILLCSTLEDDLPFRAKEFENRYRGYSRRQQMPTSVPKLIGRINTNNLAEGHLEVIEPPMLIGDFAKCTETLKLTNVASVSPITQAISNVLKLAK
jgi:hypothetical protein